MNNFLKNAFKALLKLTSKNNFHLSGVNIISDNLLSCLYKQAQNM